MFSLLIHSSGARPLLEAAFRTISTSSGWVHSVVSLALCTIKLIDLNMCALLRSCVNLIKCCEPWEVFVTDHLSNWRCQCRGYRHIGCWFLATEFVSKTFVRLSWLSLCSEFNLKESSDDNRRVIGIYTNTTVYLHESAPAIPAFVDCVCNEGKL